jgi:hypothetical protein
MSTALILAIAAGALVVLLIAALIYIVPRYYEARSDRTFMTHDERGFKRALKGKGVLWDWEESIVRGPTAPSIEFVGYDPASGNRRNVRLLDARSGWINLRPQHCTPRPFTAVTVDAHKVIVEARVMFSLNRDLLKHVYQIEDFGLALETRIQSAFRAEIGRRHDEELRGSLDSVEMQVLEHLRRAEREGDEEGEQGMALGVNFHHATFTYVEADELQGGTPFMLGAQPAAVGADGQLRQPARGGQFAAGVLALNPQHIDKLADKFKGRPAEETKALLAILEMQTRQNIAEALAASGQLIVVTPQELGLIGAAAQRDALAQRLAPQAPLGAPAPANNGGIRPAETRA